MSIYYHQISLKDTFSDYQDLFTDDTPAFFQLLNQYIERLFQFMVDFTEPLCQAIDASLVMCLPSTPPELNFM
jgi:hypothetical protein